MKYEKCDVVFLIKYSQHFLNHKLYTPHVVYIK